MFIENIARIIRIDERLHAERFMRISWDAWDDTPPSSWAHQTQAP
jgi:hypothetical protein